MTEGLWLPTVSGFTLICGAILDAAASRSIICARK
jgi:hypothetical protein